MATVEQVAQGRRGPSRTETSTSKLGEAKVRAERLGRDLLRAFAEVEEARAALHAEAGIEVRVTFEEPAIMDAYRRTSGHPFWDRRP